MSWLLPCDHHLDHQSWLLNSFLLCQREPQDLYSLHVCLKQSLHSSLSRIQGMPQADQEISWIRDFYFYNYQHSSRQSVPLYPWFSLTVPCGTGQSSSYNVSPYVVCFFSLHAFTLGSLFLRFLKQKILTQPTVQDGGVSRGRSVAPAVGCWLLALQRYFGSVKYQHWKVQKK